MVVGKVHDPIVDFFWHGDAVILRVSVDEYQDGPPADPASIAEIVFGLWHRGKGLIVPEASLGDGVVLVDPPTCTYEVRRDSTPLAAGDCEWQLRIVDKFGVPTTIKGGEIELRESRLGAV
jgi:hypothetical protein